TIEPSQNVCAANNALSWKTSRFVRRGLSSRQSPTDQKPTRGGCCSGASTSVMLSPSCTTMSGEAVDDDRKDVDCPDATAQSSAGSSRRHVVVVLMHKLSAL